MFSQNFFYQNCLIFYRSKNGAFNVPKTGLTPEEKGYSLRLNRLRKRPENTTVRRPLALPLPNPEPTNTPPEPKLTYQQLRERGFTGTRYDAEMVQNHGLYENSSSNSSPTAPVQQPLPPSAPSSRLELPVERSIKVHQRSLRSTPDRIRKRCQLGRAASDSSGISDDGSSSSHCSGSDSGIETASLGTFIQPKIRHKNIRRIAMVNKIVLFSRIF